MAFGASINSCLGGAWPNRGLQLQQLCGQSCPLLAVVGASWARSGALWALTGHPSPSPHLWMFSQPAMLLGGLLLTVAAMTVAQQRRGHEAGGRRRAHRVQYGQCSYTFVLPEPEPCPPEPEAFRASNSLQRDSPASALSLGDWPTKRVQRLEKVLENNTQWLQKVWLGLQRGWWAGAGSGSVHLRGLPWAQRARGWDPRL